MAAGKQVNNKNQPKKNSPEEMRKKAYEAEEKKREEARKNLLNKKYETMSAICLRMGRTTNTIISWITQRKFPAWRVGGRWFAIEKDIQEWEEMQRKGDLDKYNWEKPEFKKDEE